MKNEFSRVFRVFLWLLIFQKCWNKTFFFVFQLIKSVEKHKSSNLDLQILITILRNFFLALKIEPSIEEKHPSYLSVIEENINEIQFLCRFVPKLNLIYTIAAEKQKFKILKYFAAVWYESTSYHPSFILLTKYFKILGFCFSAAIV